MIGKLIDLAARHRWLVILAWIAIAIGAVSAARRVPLDAIPDLSDPQVIVFTEWKGRSPTLIEDQVTYPIASSLLAAPKVSAVRGYSMFGMSFVYVLFEEGTDLYWARSRVLEYLATNRDRLPEGVSPTLGPLADLAFQDPFVRRVGLRNVARPAHDRGRSPILKQPGFGGIGNGVRRVLPGELER